MKRPLLIAIAALFAILPLAAWLSAKEPVPTCEDKTVELGAALKLKTDELTGRELAVREEEEKVKAMRVEVERRIEALTGLTKEFDALLAGLKVADDEKIKNLAKLYESMPAEEAATRVENLDQELAVKLLKSMKSRQAGKVLGFVKPELAARLSEKFGKSVIPVYEDRLI